MSKFIKIFSIIIVILLLCSSCSRHNTKPKEQDLVQVKSTAENRSKKVILIVVDSLLSEAIDDGIKQNLLPTFQYLINHGQYYKDFVSSFPTMSVTIDSSLLTGTYPNKHHVPGLIWYSSKEKSLINYGTGPMEVIRHGIDPVLLNALIHLNGQHLSKKTPTIYEDLAQRGFKSGTINGLIYRGTTEHTLSVPFWLEGTTSLPKEIKVKGPDFMAFGSLSNPLDGIANLSDGLTQRMGLNNQYSLKVASYLIKNNKLPDFLYIYLSDLDKTLHKKGPSDLSGVIEVDQQLQSLLRAFGSHEEAIQEAAIMILGDSGVTQILPRNAQPVIELSKILNEFQVLYPGALVNEETDLVLAVNDTMAYVYKLNQNHSLRDIANVLKADKRIDFVSWKEKDWIHVLQGGTGKDFQYKANGKILDPYKQSWTLKNHLEVFDLIVNYKKHTLQYGDYPDILQRLSAALNSHEGEFMVVTAKPGYELADRSSPTHQGGGGHGSLHKTDSVIPLIICGTNEQPNSRRIVDLKPFLLRLLTKSNHE